MNADLLLICAWLQGLVCHNNGTTKVLVEEEEKQEEEVSLHQEQETKEEIKLLLTYSCAKENTVQYW